MMYSDATYCCAKAERIIHVLFSLHTTMCCVWLCVQIWWYVCTPVQVILEFVGFLMTSFKMFIALLLVGYSNLDHGKDLRK